MKQCLSFTLTDSMINRVNYYSEKWSVSDTEALRRLFSMGDFLADAFENNKRIYTIDKKTDEKERIIFSALCL